MGSIEQSFRDGFLDALEKRAYLWGYTGDPDSVSKAHSKIESKYKRLTAGRDARVKKSTRPKLVAGAGMLAAGGLAYASSRKRKEGESEEDYKKRKKRMGNVGKGLGAVGGALVGAGAYKRGKHAIRRHKELSAAKTDRERRTLKVRGYLMGRARDTLPNEMGHYWSAYNRAIRDMKREEGWAKDKLI